MHGVLGGSNFVCFRDPPLPQMWIACGPCHARALWPARAGDRRIVPPFVRVVEDMKNYNRLLALIVLPLCWLLAACEEEAPEVVEAIRAIKTITVSERGSGRAP